MAFKPNKNGVVTGTNKSDKINWSDTVTWKKDLTVNAGSGNDTIDFKKSTYKNKLNSQDGNDNIYGGYNNDTINGGIGSDKLYGYDGNDSIKGGSGNDTIDGGSGNDKIYGETGIDNIKGGNGDDSIWGGNDNDKLYGQTGNDSIKGGSGNDTIDGGSGNDRLYGETGNDTIKASYGNDQIWGGKGNDKIYFQYDDNIATFSNGDGNDTVYSGTGNDTLKFTGFTNISKLKSGISVSKSGNNLILKYNSNKDSITLTDYFKNNSLSVKNLMANDNDQIDLTAFLNSKSFSFSGQKVTGTIYNDVIKGTSKDDIINGDNGNDKLYGEEGNDNLKGGNGNDSIWGGNGNDTLYGQTGDDSLKGGNGNDSIDGGTGNDKLYGEAGNDTIKASYGDDQIWGGKGNDTIYTGAGTDTIIINKGDGNDTVYLEGTKTTVQIQSVNAKDSVSYKKSGNDLIMTYTHTKASGEKTNTKEVVTLKNYFNADGTVKNEEIYLKTSETVKIKDKITNLLPKEPVEPTAPINPDNPDPTTPSLTINGARVTVGTDNADTLNVSTGTNRIYAGAGNDTITTGSGTNYVYGGSGNDIITSGAGNDIIFGGGGKNTIYLGKGSGNDVTLDENDNTFVFKNITNLNQLTFTAGAQDSLGTVADLVITGYGNSTDSLTILNFFNLEGYDYSKIKLQAGTNGTPVSLYELINNSDLKTSYFTGTWKPRHNSPTSSPAQKAPQIDSVIYGNNPSISQHNVILGTAGGNNTFYSGGTNEGLMGQTNGGFTMIYGGDGDEIIHAEGNKFYYNGQTYEDREHLIVVTKKDGTKEIKNGVFYNTAIADEQPYTKWVNAYGDSYSIYYTGDSNIINQAIENDYVISRGFLSDGTNNINYVEYITPGTGAVEGGGGNDTFYTGYGATAGDGNDTIIGSGVMYGNRGDDKFVLTDEYNDSLDPMYHIYTNSGNDYVDTTKISDEFDGIININFNEGVNTVKVDGKHNINIGIDTTSTFREEEPVNKFIETRYSFEPRPTHYTAFEQNGDLYIASNNGRGGGTLIIKDWSNLSDTQKDNITVTYRELLATTNYTSSTYTINEFLKIIDGTSESFIADGNGRHTYINEYGNEKINETYTFNVINNSDGALSSINENGETQVATRNTYDDWNELTGTEQTAVDYLIIGGNGAQTIYGGDGNDVIYGDNLNGHDENGNYIYATANDGDDTIYGGKGNDYLIGGAGNDFIDGGSGTDYLDGGDGNDTLVGGTLGTTEEFNKAKYTAEFNLKEIHGGNGNDTIYSIGAYTDNAFDSDASKTYLGGDTYFTNNIYGGAGDDEIHANAYRDVVYAGKGNDTITSYAKNNDSYYNSNAASEIYGEEGNDHIILKSHADVRAFGGDGDDIIDARDSQVVYYNTLWGDNGNDTIYGGSGKDIIYTGLGDNHVEAGGGDDEIYGSNEWLGRGGDNYIDAGAGNDYIRTSGSSTVLGGEGNDTIYIATGYRNAPSNLYINGGAGDDTYIADGGYGFDTIVASEGKDVIQFKGFVKNNTSYQYNGNDLVLSYTSDGYPAGLILKDYKLGGFSNFTIKTYGGYDENYAQNGQFKMADFINYLNGSYSMATAGTNGDDAISATGNVNGLAGNDFILAHSTTSTEANPQVINTGSGNNSVLAQSEYSNITGGTGNDEYNLQSRITTLVDNGGNNTITAAPSGNYAYYLLDITLNGNGDNTIKSTENANYSYYKINATGTGKQTIDVNSVGKGYGDIYDENNNYVETITLKTEITTGSGNDDITIFEGIVNAGLGDDTITVKDGAASGSYYTYAATLKGDEGNDRYVIEGGHNWDEERISVDLKAFIDDSQGSNTVTFTSDLMSHDSLNILLNVNADGTLSEFTYLLYNSETQDNDIVGTGYTAFMCGDMDLTDAGTVSTASNNGWYYCDGVRFADKGTIDSLSKIEASDGYYISDTTIATLISNAAAWLTSGGRNYASVMDAIKPEGQYDFNQDNYNALYAIFNNESTWTQGV